MKSRQFCSVCKEWLEMEVVPTSDGEDDDGVIWFRCPQCQGFLPKLSGAGPQAAEGGDSGSPEAPAGEGSPGKEAPPKPATKLPDPPVAPETVTDSDESLPWDSPADMMAATRQAAPEADQTDLAAGGEDSAKKKPARKDPSAESKESPEPVHEFAALLAAKDHSDPTPYRPWETYEVGQCIMHQAWEDCGIVVAKEELPGGRLVIKCYFEEAGVVRLIEKASR